MKASVGYVYSAEGHMYVLEPEFTVGAMKIHIIGCGIYNMQLEYLGYWDNFNMPQQLLIALLKWVKVNRADEILRRRTKLMQQNRGKKS